MEKREVVSKNEEVATHFKNYFYDITKWLNIENNISENKLSDGPLLNAIQKYETHPNLIKIKPYVEITYLFDFNFINRDDISKIINSLDPS